MMLSTNKLECMRRDKILSRFLSHEMKLREQILSQINYDLCMRRSSQKTKLKNSGKVIE